jgi:hypothetical protein
MIERISVPLGRAVLLLVCGVTVLAASSIPAGTPQPPDPALEELLRLHHVHRVAHVTGRAEALAATLADTLLEIGSGRLQRHSRAEATRRFEAYFGASTLLEWEDVHPPVVSLSADRTMAIVHVGKRVRLVARRTGAEAAETAERFGWTEAWRRERGEWRLISMSSTRGAEPDPFSAPPQARVEAARILRAARDAMGGEAAVARVAMLSFEAECDGPRGPFSTRVVSARDGRVRFEQRFPDGPGFAMGIGLEGDWRRPDTDTREAHSPAARAVLYAHEMLLLALAPEARYRAPFATGRQDFHGRDADVVRFADPLDAPIDFFYDAGDGRPLGFCLRNHTGRGADQIEVRYDDWRAAGELRLPFAATITQGADIYRYRMTEVGPGWVAAPEFEGD